MHERVVDPYVNRCAMLSILCLLQNTKLASYYFRIEDQVPGFGLI